MSRRSSRHHGWSRAIGVKVAAISIAFGAAGVAVAASTGVLPIPIGEPLATIPAPSRQSADPGGSWASLPGEAGSDASTAPTAAADRAALVGLCRAYVAAGDRDPERALDGTSFASLVAAAGGADRIAPFCADLLAVEASPSRTPPPHPSSAPTAHPSGPPAAGEPRPSETGVRR